MRKRKVKAKDAVIRLHERLYDDIARHIQNTGFESVSAFVHHVMADIVSTGELALGGDVPEAEARLVRKRLEALGYIESREEGALIPAHGGLEEPVDLLVPPDAVEAFVRECRQLDAYALAKDDLPLAFRIGDGVLSPLEGPMNREDVFSVLERGVIVRDGKAYAWTVPVVFLVHEDQARALKEGDRLALIDDKNDLVGRITVEDLYPFDRAAYLEVLYGTDRPDHPGAAAVLRDPRTWGLAGRVEILPERPNPLLSDILLPARKTRTLIRNRRWQKAVAFHAFDPPLRIREYALVAAAEHLAAQGDLTGVVLSPLINDGADDFVPSETRLKCFRELLDKRLLGKGDKSVELWNKAGYDLTDQVVLLGLEMKRYHAGPREAVMQAVFRQNLGCTHIVFGEGEEGEIRAAFERLQGALEIEPFFAGPVGYFKELGRVAPVEAGEEKGWVPQRFSEEAVRETIRAGKMPDPRMIRPEMARILRSDYDLFRTAKATNVTWHHASINKEDREALNDHKGIVIWFTGLSASGKSSVAHSVETKLYERGVRTYVLDGDNIRQGLNANLGFSPEDREENIRRIGHVAKLFADAGVVVMTAFISPYRKDRDQVRALLPPGEFLEVFVDCPVEICEKRDPKGLYKKARAGQIPQFTGISAPYEPPEKPEIHLDAGTLSIEACADEVIRYLEENELVRRR